MKPSRKETRDRAHARDMQVGLPARRAAVELLAAVLQRTQVLDDILGRSLERGAMFDLLARDRDVIGRREFDKWGFLPPGGESYAQLTLRMGEWYRTVERDVVVAAHGGTGRALIAHLAIAAPADAARYSIDQGVVYVFAGSTLTRHG